MEFPEGEQSSNLSNYGRLKELLKEFAKSFSMSSKTGTAEAAMSSERRLEGSTVVVDGDSTRPSENLENGRVPDESPGGGVAVETSSGDYHQDNDKESECRICQMSTTTDVVINLGCRCKLYLGRAHAVCAETWFRLKGNRQCEICGETAKYVQIPEAMDNSAPRLGTSIVNNGHGKCLKSHKITRYHLFSQAFYFFNLKIQISLMCETGEKTHVNSQGTTQCFSLSNIVNLRINISLMCEHWWEYRCKISSPLTKGM